MKERIRKILFDEGFISSLDPLESPHLDPILDFLVENPIRGFCEDQSVLYRTMTLLEIVAVIQKHILSID